MVATLRAKGAGTHRASPSRRLGLGCAPLGNLYQRGARGTRSRHCPRGARTPAAGYFWIPRHTTAWASPRSGWAGRWRGQDRAALRRSPPRSAARCGRAAPRTRPRSRWTRASSTPPDRARVVGLQPRTASVPRLESSLERLGLDAVDIVYLHDLGRPRRVRCSRPASRPSPNCATRNVVRAIGFGMNHSDLLARFVADLDVDVVLCAGRWTLLERTAFDDLLPVCARRGTSVVVGGVYNSGLLADPPARTRATTTQQARRGVDRPGATTGRRLRASSGCRCGRRRSASPSVTRPWPRPSSAAASPAEVARQRANCSGMTSRTSCGMPWWSAACSTPTYRCR